VLALLRRIAIDVSPLGHSREFRLLIIGEIVSNLGTQAALVALPYQIFVISHSAALVGLLGAFELGPMIVVSLLGGALADRADRRLVLAGAQAGVITASAALAVAALAGKPPVALVLVLGGLLAGSSALDNVTRSSIIPGLLRPADLRSGLAFNYGMYQATGIIGPAVGGLLIAAAGVGVTYVIDSVSCLAMVGVAVAIGPQLPKLAARPAPIGRSIAEGLRFVRSNNALSGSFAIDLVAMTFGWPRALFAVLSLTVYHEGASGTGLLYAALSAGGTLAVLTSGWAAGTRRLGRIVILAVLGWGGAVALLGLVRSIALAMILLGIAGFADGISAFCRATINQTVTPDHLRGRMSSVYSLVVTSGPRLGDIESGLVAGLTSATVSVATGGLACIAGVGTILLAFPALARYDQDTAARELVPDEVAAGRTPGRESPDRSLGRSARAAPRAGRRAPR
jgi:MFS family permease